MIRVVRRASPAVLAKNATRWLREYIEARNQYDVNASNKTDLEKAESKYKHPKIKEALRKTFHDKCAYCESPIAAVSYGDIEHFRPKSHFPQYCFDWENLLLSCSICNNAAHKADHFPVDAVGNPLLVNPCVDDPKQHFAFTYHAELNAAEVTGLTAQGRETERLLGLNRLDLVLERSKACKKIAFIVAYAADGDRQALDLIPELTAKEANYAAFARAMCDQLGVSY